MDTNANRTGSGCSSSVYPRACAIWLARGRSRFVMVACAGLCMACTSLLPMTDDLKSSMSEADVKRVAEITHLSETALRDPKIHEVHEVRMSCWQMIQQCYPGMPLYLKVLGSVPLGCTRIYQQPWNEKVAIIYSCWITDPITMKHERRHARGEMHANW